MAEHPEALITVRIPTPLRGYTNGADQVTVPGATVGDALIALGAAHPGILERVLAADGSLRQFVNIYLGSENIRVLHGLVTPLTAGAVLAIIPAVAGGAGGKEHRLAVALQLAAEGGRRTGYRTQRHRGTLRFNRALAMRSGDGMGIAKNSPRAWISDRGQGKAPTPGRARRRWVSKLFLARLAESMARCCLPVLSAASPTMSCRLCLARRPPGQIFPASGLR